MHLEDIKQQLAAYGLIVRGVMTIDGTTDHSHRILVGNAGSKFWPVFTRSAEHMDQRPDPLDRWTQRIGDALATQVGAEVIYPFDGPPYPPFLSWASQADTVAASPLSIFIHPQFGLWHAWRFALEMKLQQAEVIQRREITSLCESCVEKPCLNACPVDAFSFGHYEVDICREFLDSKQGSSCVNRGCAARRACPYGKKFRYTDRHAEFHMRAFMASKLRVI